jgi:hypothetical protein
MLFEVNDLMVKVGCCPSINYLLIGLIPQLDIDSLN